MLNLDTLNQLKQLKQEIKDSRNLSEGTVKGTPSKFGFVNLDAGKDVYLPAEEMEKVLPGDRVEVEIIKDDKNKKVAKIERLLSSPTTVFCGKYITKGKTHFVEPDIIGMNRWFFIPPQKRKNAQNKDLVVCRVTQHPYKTGNAQASIVEVIGQEQDIGIEFNYASKKHSIRKVWPKEVEAELNQFSEDNITSIASQREDLSSLPFITIDSASTVDIDDALYVEANDNGWLLYVAIADPTAVIPKGSALEKEILARASSLYFPGQHISMMPEKIASDLCSLREGMVRLAKVVKLQIDQDGTINEYTLQEAAIKSHRKFNYPELTQHYEQQAIADLDPSIKEMLDHLKSATDALLSSRKTKALVQPERKEFYIELDEQQKIAAIKPKQTTIAHRIVEEAMVACNRSIADYLSQQDIPSIFVSHPGLRQDRLESVNNVLKESLDNYTESTISSLEGFVTTQQQLSQDEMLKPLYTLISRQLDKSELSTEAKPHFGMGLRCYTTFTSPLRKAQDYLIHQQISDLLKGKKTAIDTGKVTAIAEASQAIRQAVYDAEQWLKCQFIAKQTEVVEATVLRVFTTGFQVKLVDNGIEGFVSTKEMDGKYSFNQDRMLITHKDESYELDQVVQVKLKHIDWTRKQIQFDLINNQNVTE